MIKTILVGLDGSEHSRTAIRYALWLGGRFGARVVGLHIVDIVSIEGSFFHDVSGSLGFEPYLDFSNKIVMNSNVEKPVSLEDLAGIKFEGGA